MTLSPTLYVTMSPTLYVTMSPTLYVTMSPTLYVTMSPTLCVTMSPTLHVTMSSTFYVTMSPTLCVNVLGKYNCTPVVGSIVGSITPFMCCQLTAVDPVTHHVCTVSGLLWTLSLTMYVL